MKALIPGVAAALAAATFATAACAPPPKTGPVARCGVTPVTHRIIQWTSDNDHTAVCGTEGHIVIATYPCGPLLLTKAADDVCGTYLQAKTGEFITGPLSGMVTGDKLYATYP